MKLKGRFLVLVAVIFVASCKTVPFKVNDGPTAVNLKLYNQSIDFLLKEFGAERDPDKKAEKAFTIAESYRQFHDLASAEKWYQQSVDLKMTDKALFQLGMAQKGQEKYAEAMKTFAEYQKVAGTGFEGRQQELQCQQALLWKKDFSKIEIINLQPLNTPANDYALIPFKQNQFVLSSSRDEATGANRDGWTGEKFTDLFITDKTGKIFSTPVNMGPPICTPAHESSAAFSKDGKEIYFIRCQDDQQKSNQYCHLYYSAFNNNHWEEPVKLDFFPDTANVYDPYLSSDGKVLLVASDVPGGFGATDIYIINKVDTGWGMPQNLGGRINTPGSERFPWLDVKGHLFFSSDGLPGMGGLDIFKSLKFKTGYKDPENLKAPINSGADDYAFRIDKYKPDNSDDTVLYAGYFSSNRPGGKGGDDIYRFEEKWLNIFVLRGKIVEKNYEKPDDPDSKVLGMKYLGKARVDLKTPDDKIIASVLSDSLGNFAFRLSSESDYKVSAIKNGYFSNTSSIISTKGKRNQDSTIITLYTQLELEKIFPQKMIVIPNIYYDYDKATLRPESKLVLDSILVFFKDNPDLTIEIGSHTDSRGSDSYNLKLSQARAQSVVDYLVDKGIPKERLIAKGYGETMLVNNCGNGVPCTEEEHQKNRRTTFKVISAKLNLESVQPEDIRVVPKPEEQQPEK
ncbi:MAG TPA: OmpA family protein [Chitinophagales bacterium]|nr:OmpA family protein [Chitinophagales bacterium]